MSDKKIKNCFPVYLTRKIPDFHDIIKEVALFDSDEKAKEENISKYIERLITRDLQKKGVMGIDLNLNPERLEEIKEANSKVPPEKRKHKFAKKGDI